MKNAFFSVIVPFYNVENFIRDCCLSLKNQSFSNFEAIFIDDGSKDKSLDILKDEIGEDSRFKIIYQLNQGQAVARNNGLRNSSGKYILYLDSDDYLSDNLLETLYFVLNQNMQEVIQFNYNFVDLEGNFVKASSLRNSFKRLYGIDLNKISSFNINLIKGNCFVDLVPNCWTRCYSKEFLLKNNIEFPSTPFEDSVFANKVLVKAKSIFYIDKALYNYRTRNGSTMSSKSIKVLDVFKNVEIMRAFLEESKLIDSFKKQLDNYELFQVATAVACLPLSLRKEFVEICQRKMSFKQYVSIRYLLFPSKSVLRFFSIFYWAYKLNKHKWKWNI